MADRSRVTSKPCNHINHYAMGFTELIGGPENKVMRRPILWCRNCGAITFSTGWMHPERAWIRRAKGGGR